MRVWRVLVGIVPALWLGGCGYVHFGRMPKLNGDAELERAYVDLSVQRKILQQELVLARKETDTLRDALDHAAAGPAPAATQLSRELESTSQELATLRANYAKLKAERGVAPPANAVSPASDQKLAVATHDAEQLRTENEQLKRELDAARAENATLAEKLKTSLAATERAEAAVTRLDQDLASQRDARAQTERAMDALKAQLEAVMARAAPAESAAAAGASASMGGTPIRQPAPVMGENPGLAQPQAGGVNVTALAELEDAKARASGEVPSAEFRTGFNRNRTGSTTPGPARSAESVGTSPASPTPVGGAAAASAPAPAATASTGVAPAAHPATPPTDAAATQTYKVKAGDTLEKLALRFYGAADQWGKIYAANSELLGTNQGLKPGMELQIPEK